MTAGTKVPGSTKLLFALPSFVGAAMTIPVLVHMQPFYSDVVLLPVGYIALAIAVARSLDALTDPLIGWWSDRTETRFGRRKPWIVAGVAACAVSFYLLFNPPVSLGASEAAAWFALTFSTYFLFHTIYEIPYIGLGAELSSDYHERSGLFGIRSMMIGVGTIIAGAMPTILDAAGIHDKRRAFHVMATGYVVLFIVLWALLIAFVPEKKHDASKTTSPLVPGIRRALRNRPFRVFLAASVVYAIPSIIPALLMPYYVNYVLAPPNPLMWLGIFLVIYLGAGVFCVPIWVRLSYRFGKLPVWIACNVIGVIGGALLFFAGKGDLKYVAWVQAFVGTQSAAFFFLAPAMVADVTDYDELRTGKRREAQYMAFMTFVPKFVAIPGASIPLAILGALGYVPNQVQSAEVQTAIRTIFALVPACFNAGALFVIMKYPLTESVHREILEGLSLHREGKAARDPITHKMIPSHTADRAADDQSWFLDHFSVRELVDLRASRDVASLERRTLFYALASVIAACAAATICIGSVHGIAEPPGPVAILSVVAAGFAVCVAVFHGLRFHAARKLRTRTPADDVIQKTVDAGAV